MLLKGLPLCVAQEAVSGATLIITKLSSCNHAPRLVCICISQDVNLNHSLSQNNLE